MFESLDPTTPTTVSLRTPGDLIASLPALLGFTPQRSVVAISMRRHGERSRLSATARVDLPETAEQATAVADAVAARLATGGADRVQLIVIDEQPGTEHARPPHAGLVEMFTAAFTAADLAVSSPLWAARVAAGARWRCYDPCGCAGAVPDPGATTAAAHTALAGKVTYSSREEAAATLDPDPEADSPRRRELLDDASRHAAASRGTDQAGAVREDLATVRAAAARVGRGEALPEALLARVAVALRDPAVRDVCLGFAAGRDPAVDPAAAGELWRRLTRLVPAPEVAEPATLLAFAALRDGGGVALSVALERAMHADRGHQLSRLLDQIIAAGVSPERIEAMVLGAAGEAEQLFHR
jgi:hypothetical protein